MSAQPAPDMFSGARLFKPTQERCETCRGPACMGWGPPLVPSPRWWCPRHRPADFYTFRG